MIIVSMFDESGNALRPWAEAGYQCHAFDWLNTGRTEYIGCIGGSITYHYGDLTDAMTLANIIALKPDLVMGWPDCTHMTVAGTGSWARKRAVDPFFQYKAVMLARTVEFVGNFVGCPWMCENPVGVLATMWRKPDHYFHPCDYGWYLPADDVHPRWPDYIPPQDRYTKRTCLWTGNGWKMPYRMPIDPIILENENGVRGSPQFMKLGGKSAKTKQIRSETPRGFARANFIANCR